MTFRCTRLAGKRGLHLDVVRPRRRSRLVEICSWMLSVGGCVPSDRQRCSRHCRAMTLAHPHVFFLSPSSGDISQRRHRRSTYQYILMIRRYFRKLPSYTRNSDAVTKERSTCIVSAGALRRDSDTAIYVHSETDKQPT